MKRLIALLTACLALALAASAVANVLVYKNGFGKRADVQRINKLQGGGKCKREWKGKKAYGVRVNDGERDCLYRTPVEGDSKRPDYVIQAVARVQKQTSKRIREKVYIGLAGRANRKSGYEIRVFPKGRRYELLKNGVRVEAGRNTAVAALDRQNRLRLSIEKNTVVAKVNGKRLAKFQDRDSEEVVGRKTALAFGSEAKINKDGFGVFDRVKVLVPSP